MASCFWSLTVSWLASLQGTGSIDAVVAFNGLASAGADARKYFAEVARILKPGAPFVFIDRGLHSSPSALVRVACNPTGSQLQRLLWSV
jgi:SAM-dependent methyltransferase